MSGLDFFYERIGKKATNNNTLFIEGDFLVLRLPNPYIVFNKTENGISGIPDCKGGVYLLSDKYTKEIVYVGTSNNLKKRLAEHMCRGGIYTRDKHIIYWFLFKNDWERKVIEKLYQWVFKPPYGVEDKRNLCKK